MQDELPQPDPEVAEPVPEETDQPEKEPSEKKEPGKHKKRWQRFKSWFATHKKWSIPATVLLILVILAVIPWIRFHAAGLFLKKDFTVQITDSTANKPVSGATVNIGPITATTNGSGKATLRGVKVGNHNISISKKYYQGKSAKALVPILGQKSFPNVNLVATGRQVKIKVTNLITGKALAEVNIAVGDANAKTDKTGAAVLVLPADAISQKGQLSLSGYNNADVKVLVSNSNVKENDFKLTPAGKVYFFSNQTGTLNLMKANLDGTGAKVAAAGTGTEQISNSSIMQSPDGKYVALVAKRSASDPQPQLYVLSASDDKLLQADSGNAIFQLYAWSGDTLVYTLQRQDLPVWQQGAAKIKAYDATSGSTTLLDQTAGSDATVNANEYYSEVMVASNSVIYSKIWQGSGDLTVKQNSLQTIGIDGQGHQSLATYNVADNVYFSRHSPDMLYVWQHAAGSGADTYSQYSAGGTLKTVSITNDQFYQGLYSYYFSPDGKQTFWAENRDGKNTMLVGDQSGNNTSTAASLSDYAAYGWYTDQYLLLSKNSSELYIMGVKGGTPTKITNYQATGGFGY